MPRRWNMPSRHISAGHRDDLREPTFLEELRSLLVQHPEAGLACCAARDIDWHGNRCNVHRDTSVTAYMNQDPASARFRQYLPQSPCTPIYGLFRRGTAQSLLRFLRSFERRDQGGLFRSDALFLAAFVARFRAVYTEQPLFLFRCGGSGQRLDNHSGLRDFLLDYLQFGRRLIEIAGKIHGSHVERLRLRLFTLRYLVGYLFHSHTRGIVWHHVLQQFGFLKRWRAMYDVYHHPAFTRLKQLARQVKEDHRVVLLGAGKHTQRHLPTIRCALEKRHRIVGIVDDHPGSTASMQGVPVHPVDRLASLDPSVILVSSDTYEGILLKRAREIAPPGVEVWTIYEFQEEVCDVEVTGLMVGEEVSVPSTAV